MNLSAKSKEIGPNLFASVMGTGIIANAAVTLPGIENTLDILGLVFWLTATVLLFILTVLKIFQAITRPHIIKKQFDDPVMGQFFGAPPMAFLTVAGGFVLLGGNIVPHEHAITIAWWLWIIGTVLGLMTAITIPYLLFTRYTIRDDAAFGGWLMPVVPPMVSAAVGALLIPYAGSAEAKVLMLYGCYCFFGISFMASLIIITMIWSRLAHSGSSGGGRVPTLWIILGPLGQSITAAGALGTIAITILPEPKGATFNDLSLIFGLPVWGFAMFWGVIASLLTIRAHKLNMKFGLTWWAFTFPVGTCVTGTAQIANHSKLPFFEIAAYLLFLFLLIAWLIAAIGTAKGVANGELLSPPTNAPDVIAKKHNDSL
ncbi:TDT family transporter [Photobacterium satsumensis]|uniref:TDT family transporter n=1 Tax=Photobacterium satsumensis TaxID=2910239 RepID=UPI003D1273E2